MNATFSKALPALCGSILLLTPPLATAQQFGDFNYTSNGAGIFITGYTGTNSLVVIPDFIAGVPVVTIGESAFRYSSLTGVSIPATVTNIASSAFYGCSNLASVTISNGVSQIGRTAFSYCHSLTNVFLPASVSLLQGAPFSSCSNLTAILVDATNPAFSSWDGVLFDKSLGTLIQCPAGKSGSYVLPGTITEIGLGAFANCRGLTEVILPETLKNIGQEALHHCLSLTHVEIPGSVTNIGHDAFKNCTSLASVTLSEGLTTIGWAFRFCSNLTSITIPRSVTFIWEQAFDECTSLRGVFFKGNAPGFSGAWTPGVYRPTGYYLPGTTGWGATFAGQPTVLWNPLMEASGPSFGVGPGGFGFKVTGTADIPMVIESTTNLADANWVSLQSLNLTNGTFYFSDPVWLSHPARNYRIRSPY